jgi:hypothetical protein
MVAECKWQQHFFLFQLFGWFQFGSKQLNVDSFFMKCIFRAVVLQCDKKTFKSIHCLTFLSFFISYLFWMSMCPLAVGA